MAHTICGAIFKATLEPCALERFDLSWQALPQGFYLLYFSNAYCQHWALHLGIDAGPESAQNISSGGLPSVRVIAHILRAVSEQAEPLYALILTDPFDGVDEPYAALYQGEQLRPLADAGINTALRALGVEKTSDSSEFDAVPLDAVRSPPAALDFYRDGPAETVWVPSPKRATVVHIVWDTPQKAEFLEVFWYDKPAPFKACLARLEALKARSLTQSLLITSFGKRHHITTQAVFRRWVREVFEGGLDHGFSSRLFPE